MRIEVSSKSSFLDFLISLLLEDQKDFYLVACMI